METTYSTPLQVLRRTIADIKQDISFHKYTLSGPELIDGQFPELRKEVKKLQKLLKQYEEVLGMAKAHRRDCTYSPQDLTQQDKEMTALRKRVEELESLLRSAMGYNSTGHSVPNHMCELIDRLLNHHEKQTLTYEN